jgi:phosphate transport system substrate-binding protein
VKEMLVEGETDNSSGPAPVRTQKLAQTDLHGAGATFPAPLYQKWFESFQRQYPGIHITYDPVGSETGTRQLAENKLDFAGSDVSWSDGGPVQAAEQFRRFATVLGGVVPIYNLKGLAHDLKFTPETLADIYLGKVTRWNDPRIKASNKEANLPDSAIVIIHRSDGSGTTYAWSDFLSKTSPDWRSKVGNGTTLQWPAGNGAKGNDGVASAVQATPDSIGYVELIYAIQHDLSFGAVRNSAGEFIRADLRSLAEAAKAATSGAAFGSGSSITNAPGKAAYPIAAFTWLLFPEAIGDPTKRAAAVALLRWMLTSGQKECSSLGYAPLPREVAARQLELLSH